MKDKYNPTQARNAPMKPLSLIAALSVALAFASSAVAGPVPLKGTVDDS